MRKLLVTSITSLLLLITSGLIAALLPHKSENIKLEDSEKNGTIISNSGDGGGGGESSCKTDITNNWSCHVTRGDATITTEFVQSDIGINRTVGNTSSSIPNNGLDTTSELF